MLERAETSNEYLRLDDLTINGVYRKIAYVFGVKTGVSSLDKGYYTFYLKDIDANVVNGIMFEIKNFIEQGYDLIYFKNKPVEIEFKATTFAGMWSLQLDSIKVTNAPIQLERFIGKVDNSGSEKIESIYKTIMPDFNIPREYALLSLASICNGRCGGALKLFTTVSSKLVTYNEFPNVELKNLLWVFTECFDVYINYLKLKNEFYVTDTAQEYGLLQKLYFKHKDKKVFSLLIDVACALIGLSKPKHLYSHMIVTELNDTVRNFELIYKNNILPLGTSASIVGDGELLRY